MNDRIENQTITETIPIQGFWSGASIGTWQEDYPLTALDFERLIYGKPQTFTWASGVFIATLGFGLNLLGKGMSGITGAQQQILLGEWIALAFGFLISVVLYFIGLALPNERKKVVKKIQQHFEDSPKQ